MSISVSFVGRMGSDAEVKRVGERDVVEMRVAVNYRRGRDENTAWLRVSYWARDGHNLARLCVKGREVFVIGRLQPREYESQGQTRTSLDVDAIDIRLVGSRPEHGQSQRPRDTPQPRRDNTPAPVDDSPMPGEDDLPF